MSPAAPLSLALRYLLLCPTRPLLVLYVPSLRPILVLLPSLPPSCTKAHFLTLYVFFSLSSALIPGLSVPVQRRSHESAKKATFQIRFVIVGGGPAGLACAVALRRVGHHVIVLEKGPDFIGVRTTPRSLQVGFLVVRHAHTKVSHSQAGTAASVFHRT